MSTILWLRRDLRRDDLPALVAAHEAAGDGRVLPVFVLDPRLWNGAGEARRAALRDALQRAQEEYDGALVVRRGDPAQVLAHLATQTGATSVHVSGESTPFGRRRGEAVHAGLAALPGDGVAVVATGTPYAVSPGRIRTQAGTPYQVFTPFARAWRAHGHPGPARPPAAVRWLTGVPSDDLPGTADASPAPAPDPRQAWRDFLDEGLGDYDTARDRPDLDATSRVSEHLKFGALHPRTLLADVAAHPAAGSTAARRFVDQLIWREFYADVLWHRPESAWHDLRPLGDIGTDPDADEQTAHRWDAWCAGRTGYPYVDAGMRQLLAQGWMHNRLRMVTASFLVKDLHIRWQHGARFFLAHLRDGDLASNNHGWQWAAGTGTDAAPYVRVFNPITQGRRFDPDGDYVRRHVPELAHVAGAAAHEPWNAPDGYTHGYPQRIVDHAAERREALRRFHEVSP